MSSEVATRQESPVAKFSRFMDGFKAQMALALPKHMTPDRMARLAVTAFSTTPKLQECEPKSIAGAIMTASTLGLEPGVGGQGFLVPYYDHKKKITVCQFIPGWKGLVDIVNRAGRASVWTGAVFSGDHFEYALGDRPFINHKPGDEDDPAKMTHVYAVGRVNGSDWPVIEVWTINKVRKHRDKYNKVGEKHYSFRDWEMYAKKVPLLQVIKYMPSSIELSNAIAANNAAEMGRTVNIDLSSGGNFVTVDEEPEDDQATGAQAAAAAAEEKRAALPMCTPEAFDKKKASWQAIVEKGTKSVNDLIATIELKETLTQDQKVEIASWAHKKSEGNP